MLDKYGPVEGDHTVEFGMHHPPGDCDLQVKPIVLSPSSSAFTHDQGPAEITKECTRRRRIGGGVGRCRSWA
ncbi:MAG: hypothetical protein OEW83_22505 [Acidimicrobiia bacterium]|nr:hypothetical protein [Acidimicrobiia bacterium]